MSDQEEFDLRPAARAGGGRELRDQCATSAALPTETRDAGGGEAITLGYAAAAPRDNRQLRRLAWHSNGLMLCGGGFLIGLIMQLVISAMYPFPYPMMPPRIFFFFVILMLVSLSSGLLETIRVLFLLRDKARETLLAAFAVFFIICCLTSSFFPFIVAALLGGFLFTLTVGFIVRRHLRKAGVRIDLYVKPSELHRLRSEETSS